MPDTPPPSGWRWTPLSDVARLESGHTPSRKKPEYWGGDIPWIGIRDATGNHGRVLFDTEQHTNELGIANSSARVLPAHTVCLSRTASVGYVVAMGRPMATSQDFVNWVCGEHIDWRYLKYVLIAERESYSRFAHGTTHQTIYFPEVKAFHVCLPPTDEQRRIAGVLGALDDKIEHARKLGERLNLTSRLIYRKLVNRAPTQAGWHARPIGEMVTVLGGSTPSTHEPAYWDGTINFATPKDLASLDFPVLIDTARRLTDAGLAQISSGALPKGTVLLSSRAPIGYVAITETPVAVNQGFIAMICDRGLTNHFMLRWAEANHDTIVDYANGTTFLEINKRSFRTIPVEVPPDGELEAFDAEVGPVHQKLVATIRESTALLAVRDALLPKLVSGRILVNQEYQPGNLKSAA
jgi:type I restriction enzyme S subunit